MFDVNETIFHFIEDMKYIENEHVLGAFFYGSYLTGYNEKHSDIDILIIFDNDEPNHLIRGNKYIDGIRIEYFEKPINEVYLTIENEYHSQNNASLSIIGTSKILFDKNGSLRKLQDFALKQFSKPLPPLDLEDAREYVSILNNRMEKVRKAAYENNPNFTHLYHLTIEKIRKFYHKLNGLPAVQTSKVYRVYLDEEYRKSFYKDDIPENEFVSMYISAVTDVKSNNEEKLKKVEKLFDYAKRNVFLDSNEYRILIKSRNLNTINKN